MFEGLDGVPSGRKIYTGSGRTSLHPVFGGSRYQHLYCSILILGLQAGERGRWLPSLLFMRWPKDYESGALNLAKPWASWRRAPCIGSGLCSPLGPPVWSSICPPLCVRLYVHICLLSWGSISSWLTLPLLYANVGSVTGNFLRKELSCCSKTRCFTSVKSCLSTCASIVWAHLVTLFNTGGVVGEGL
jgi:hypothetical protein